MYKLRYKNTNGLLCIQFQIIVMIGWCGGLWPDEKSLFWPEEAEAMMTWWPSDFNTLSRLVLLLFLVTGKKMLLSRDYVIELSLTRVAPGHLWLSIVQTFFNCSLNFVWSLPYIYFDIFLDIFLMFIEK